jgi:DNA-binding Lrp family transcriptional regulator
MVDSESGSLDEVADALVQIPNVEELYQVTGEADIVAVIRTADTDEFRDFLKNQILKIRGVRSTVTSIVFDVCKGPRKNAEHLASKVN